MGEGSAPVPILPAGGHQRPSELDSDRSPSAPPLPRSVGGTSEHEKLCRARDQCREILKYVNEAVKQTENRHRLEGYQKRLDTTSLERASNPLAAEFKVGGGDRHTHSGHLEGRRAGGGACLGQGAEAGPASGDGMLEFARPSGHWELGSRRRVLKRRENEVGWGRGPGGAAGEPPGVTRSLTVASLLPYLSVRAKATSCLPPTPSSSAVWWRWVE